ncbi:MAG: two-component sensor histidine kinase, partial [Clostridia bacterium]|nr:two-component sensor histidine kinase [Clostridia bacterium]
MIKKLRRKFVLAAMLSLFIVLAVLIFVINILNYRSLVREADDTLDTLSELDGNAPNHFTFGRKDGLEPPGGKTPGTRHDYSGERPYQSRYFSVLLSDDGEIAEVDLRNVVTVDEKTALSMASDAANAGRRRGFSNDYRYLGVPTDDGMRWIFLNREVELDTARDFLLTSCLISLAGFATVFLLL